ncbi:hypothetical protein ACF3MZ_30795 [Paenibacillaceae bacterium WGS1546]|uniref:hypothetical protein n=1 Tax=Cohnella sp. WGS1546 TaxID=3366810 RepID=UPI00372CFC04
MKKNSKQKWIGALTVLVALGLSIDALSGTARAADSAAQASLHALTSAPPPTLFGIFNPNHQYLQNGTSVATVSEGSISATGSTTAKVRVDSVGITFYLQRWTGTDWVTVGSGQTTSGSNTNVHSSNFSRSTVAGYYYRIKTVHWVNHDGVYEDGEKYTGSLLAY